MAERLADLLREAVEHDLKVLLAIPENVSRISPGPGRWTRREELGHLLDSAANNHMRFVRAGLDGSYDGPGYDQDRWVELHGYRDLPWRDLVEFWRRYNELLAQVVERIPGDRLASPCRIGLGETVTLGFVIEDYVRHLRHHLEHIASGA